MSIPCVYHSDQFPGGSLSHLETRTGAPCSGKQLTVDSLVLKQSPYTILNIQVEYAVHLPHAVSAITPQVFTSPTAIEFAHDLSVVGARFVDIGPTVVDFWMFGVNIQ